MKTIKDLVVEQMGYYYEGDYMDSSSAKNGMTCLGYSSSKETLKLISQELTGLLDQTKIEEIIDSVQNKMCQGI